MPNLPELTKLAADKNHNLTGPLTHDQVGRVAAVWFPAVFFHPRERFHPVSLPQLFTEPQAQFQTFDAEKQQRFRLLVAVGEGPDGTPLVERVDPPVVFVRSLFSSRIFGAGAAARAALEHVDVDSATIYTHGISRDRSLEYFGATRTVKGESTLTDAGLEAGDAWEPRHQPVVVHAEMRMLLETLKHELQLDGLDRESPLRKLCTGDCAE